MSQSSDSPRRHTTDKRCEVCGRCFARNEHLIRHRRTHTSERPFACPYCPVKFPRADVKDKHIKRFHKTDERLGRALPSRNPSHAKRKPTLERSRLACDHCRRKKLKCSDERPCSSCRAKGLPCTVASSSRGPGRPRHGETPLTSSEAQNFEGLDIPNGSDADPNLVEEAGANVAASKAGITAESLVSFQGEDMGHNGMQGETLLSWSDATTGVGGTIPPLGQAADGAMLASSAGVLTSETPLLFDGPDGPDSLEPIWEDFDFMEAMWQLPPLVRPHPLAPLSLSSEADLRRDVPKGFESWLDGVEESSIDTLDAETTGGARHGGHFPTTVARLSEASPGETNPSKASSNMDTAIALMMEHLKRHRSGTSTPGRREREVEARKRSYWYSKPPSFQMPMYDVEVINVLLNVGRNYLGHVFPLFADFTATQDTASVELCLAMAAIGALYSPMEGSTAVAKVLYNDSRRIHMQSMFERHSSDFRAAGGPEKSLDEAKTYILLETYGLCSGDKRSYEFSEAFHYNTVEAVHRAAIQATVDAPPHSELARQAKLTVDALEVLEAYRVLIVLRAPTLLALQSQHDDGETASAGDQFAVMTSGATTTHHQPARSLQSLVSLVPYVWMCSPRGPEVFLSPHLWRAEFVELALDRWVNSKPGPVSGSTDLPQIILYHLAHIHIHSNLGLLQNFAPKFARASRGGPEAETCDALRAFFATPEFKVARWHADKILQLVKDAFGGGTRHRRGHHYQPPAPTASSIEEAAGTLESIHSPYCVYFATLIVWYGESGAKHPRACMDSSIEAGTHLLSLLKARISKVLADALCELLSEDGN